MKMNTKKMVAAVALAAGMMPGVASAVVIDSFADGTQSVSKTGIGMDTSTLTGLDIAEVLGGSRQMDLDVTASLAGGTSGGVVNVGVLDGILSHNNDSGNFSTLVVTWDANGVGLGGVDLTAGGAHTGLALALLNSDLGGMIDFMVTDTSDNVSNLTLVAPEVTFTDPPKILFFAYEDFVPLTTTDFSSVKAIKMTLTPNTADGDYTISLFETSNPTPEPVTAALGLLSLGALGAGMGRRRTV